MRYSRFTFVENTISNSPKVPRTKFLGSDGLFCFISICKFGSFKNPFAMITSLLDFYFRFRRFILLVQVKKWFLWTMAAAQVAENHGDEWGLAWYLRWGIYTSIPTWSDSQNSLKDILSWNISQMIMKSIPISTRVVISYAMKWGILVWVFWKSMETETSTWSEFPNRGKTIIKQILALPGLSVPPE